MEFSTSTRRRLVRIHSCTRPASNAWKNWLRNIIQNEKLFYNRMYAWVKRILSRFCDHWAAEPEGWQLSSPSPRRLYSYSFTTLSGTWEHSLYTHTYKHNTPKKYHALAVLKNPQIAITDTASTLREILSYCHRTIREGKGPKQKTTKSYRSSAVLIDSILSNKPSNN